MRQQIKRVLPSQLLQMIRRHLRNIKDDSKQLIFIHIDKCGGTSLWHSIQNSQIIKSKFSHTYKVHVEKPLILKKAKYLIVIRNPIKRAISAFNWRFYLSEKDEAQRQRFDGEWEILNKYKMLNNLAEELYVNDVLNMEVSKEFQKIHHIKQNIAFYLSELLSNITSDQIFCVISTETIYEDIINHLKVTDVKKFYENGKFTNDTKKYLSENAYNNLKRYLHDDYRCIEKLLNLKESTVCDRSILLK